MEALHRSLGCDPGAEPSAILAEAGSARVLGGVEARISTGLDTATHRAEPGRLIREQGGQRQPVLRPESTPLVLLAWFCGHSFSPIPVPQNQQTGPKQFQRGSARPQVTTAGTVDKIPRPTSHIHTRARTTRTITHPPAHTPAEPYLNTPSTNLPPSVPPPTTPSRSPAHLRHCPGFFPPLLLSSIFSSPLQPRYLVVRPSPSDPQSATRQPLRRRNLFSPSSNPSLPPPPPPPPQRGS